MLELATPCPYPSPLDTCRLVDVSEGNAGKDGTDAMACMDCVAAVACNCGNAGHYPLPGRGVACMACNGIRWGHLRAVASGLSERL